MRPENYKNTKKLGPFTVYNVTPVNGGDCYLFTDGEVTFVYDTGFGFSSELLEENIRKVLQGKKLDYILLTHSHYDHALGSACLRMKFEGSKVVASSYAAYVFTRDGAKRTMKRLDDIEAKRQGYPENTSYIDELHADLVVNDGDIIMIGKHRVKIIALPGHTKDCVAYYFMDEDILLGCETTGILADEDHVIPACLVGFEQSMKAIEIVKEMNPGYFFIPHQGMIEDVQTFLEISKRDHLLIRDMIIDMHEKGMEKEEMLDTLEKVFYKDMGREIYPYAAFVENTGIMIGLILNERNVKNSETKN